jgi:phosphohistidine phosphatase
MSRILILMRHAKSSWDNSAPDDRARPLNRRGRRAAMALGDWLRAGGRLPDQVISSASRRTRETVAGLGLTTAAEFTDRLYHAGPADMHAVLSAATGRCVLMVAHNPGIAGFAARLASNAPQHPRFFDYPTGATLMLRFDLANWAALAWGTGEVLDFIVPRDLPGT